VQGGAAHGAVPSTNASSAEAKVTDVAANPRGTGPPIGRVGTEPAGTALLWTWDRPDEAGPDGCAAAPG